MSLLQFAKITKQAKQRQDEADRLAVSNRAKEFEQVCRSADRSIRAAIRGGKKAVFVHCTIGFAARLAVNLHSRGFNAWEMDTGTVLVDLVVGK
jgi:hypothetical protein